MIPMDSIESMCFQQPEKIRQGIKSLLDKYGHYINLSSVAMSVSSFGPNSCLIPLTCAEIEGGNQGGSARSKGARVGP